MAIYFANRVALGNARGNPVCSAWSKVKGESPLLGISCTGGTVGIYTDEGEPLDKENDPPIKSSRGADAEVLSWHPTMKLLAIGWKDGTLSFWSEAERRVSEDKQTHSSAITCLEWSEDGSRLLTGDEGGKVGVWKTDARGRPVPMVQYHERDAKITHICFRSVDPSDAASQPPEPPKEDGAAAELPAVIFYYGILTQEKGVVCQGDDKGHKGHLYEVDTDLVALLYYKEKGALVALSRSSTLTVHAPKDSSWVSLVKAKLPTMEGVSSLQIIGASPSLPLLTASMQITGVDCTETHVLLWNGKKAEVYELARDDVRMVSTFPSAASSMAIFKESVFRTNDSRVEVCNLQLGDGDELGEVESLQVNCSGSKVSFILTSSENQAKVDSRIIVYDVEMDNFSAFDFKSQKRYPEAHFWDADEPKLLAVESRMDAANHAENDSMGLDTQEVEVTTLFSTPDDGVLFQEQHQLDPEMEGCVGLKVPFIFFFKKVQGDMGGAQMDGPCVKSGVMRDFTGLESVDDKTRQALLNFSYHLAVGNMDDAYKAVKLIKNPNVWENMAHMVTWAGKHVLASASDKDSMVRMFNLNTEENFVLMMGEENAMKKVSSLAFNTATNSLAAGTKEGRVAMWKFVGAESDSTEGDSSRNPEDDWQLLPGVSLGSKVTALSWGPNMRLLVGVCMDGVYIMSKCVLQHKIRDKNAVVQLSADKVVIESCDPTAQAGSSAQRLLTTSMQITGAEASEYKEIDARVGTVAVQLGLIQDAAKLFVACDRYDLLNNLHQSCGEWEKAIEVAQKHDRIHLRTTYYNHARHLESIGDTPGATSAYEMSETHRAEVPRMLYENNMLEELEEYINTTQDKKLMKWWARYCESSGMFDKALECYQTAGDYLALVRVHCYRGSFQEASEIAAESNDGAAAFHLARQFENQERIPEAIQFFARAQRYNHAIRLDGIPHKEAPVLLLSKLRLVSAGGEVGLGAGDDTDPAILMRCADFFLEHGQFGKAVHLLVAAKDFEKALNLSIEHNILITEDMAEAMTPNKDQGTAEERTNLLRRIGKCCKRQGSFHLACKKYTQAGDKVKAMKVLLKSGDTEKVIFFAGVSRQKEIYIMAANYLQTLDWHNDAEIMKSIIQFYTKAKAMDSLSSFYEACAQIEIDEYRDYEKALGALREATKFMAKAQRTSPDKDERLASLNQRISLCDKFVQARKLIKTDPQEMVRICSGLLEYPPEDSHDVESAIRVGDVFALLVEYYQSTQNYEQAYHLIEKMRDRNIILSPYLDQEMVESVYKAMGVPLNDTRQQADDGEDTVGEEIDGEA
eukprot:gene5426-6578_t